MTYFKYCLVCKDKKPFIYDKVIGHGYCKECGLRAGLKLTNEINEMLSLRIKITRLQKRLLRYSSFVDVMYKKLDSFHEVILWGKEGAKEIDDLLLLIKKFNEKEKIIKSLISEKSENIDEKSDQKL